MVVVVWRLVMAVVGVGVDSDNENDMVVVVLVVMMMLADDGVVGGDDVGGDDDDVVTQSHGVGVRCLQRAQRRHDPLRGGRGKVCVGSESRKEEVNLLDEIERKCVYGFDVYQIENRNNTNDPSVVFVCSWCALSA